jgi:hypothetical protein
MKDHQFLKSKSQNSHGGILAKTFLTAIGIYTT